jgi:hypothetical protein
VGRPSTYTPEIAEAICDRLADGIPLAVICRADGMPGLRTVHDWLVKHEDFAAEYQRARDAGEDSIDSDIIDIVDAPIGKTTFGSVDTGEVQNRKLRVWARTQIRDRFNPKRRAERENDPGALVEMLAQLAERLPG